MVRYMGQIMAECDCADQMWCEANGRCRAAEPKADGPDWEGFGRDLMEDWPVNDIDGAELFEAALRNRLIREIPGGFNPEEHIDAEGICPEPGDPWYEYNFEHRREG